MWILFQNLLKQIGQFVTDNIPNDFIVQMVVFVTQNVAHRL